MFLTFRTRTSLFSPLWEDGVKITALVVETSEMLQSGSDTTALPVEAKIKSRNSRPGGIPNQLLVISCDDPTVLTCYEKFRQGISRSTWICTRTGMGLSRTLKIALTLATTTGSGHTRGFLGVQP